MTLGFWPFNGAQRRREKENDQKYDERQTNLRLKLASLEGQNLGLHGLDGGAIVGPSTCFKCGGLFIAEKLQHRYTITLFNDQGTTKEPDVKKASYCGSCLPPSNLEIVLENRYGQEGVLDTVYFSTKEHYLQPFDFQGIEQTLIAADEYGLLYCGDCDEYVTPSKPRKCRKCIAADSKK